MSAWAIDTSGTGLVPFHLINKGAGWLHVEEQPPQLLQAGDFVLFPRDIPHIVSGEPKPPDPQAVISESNGERDDHFASILCGFYAFRKAFKATMGVTPRQVRMGGTETI